MYFGQKKLVKSGQKTTFFEVFLRQFFQKPVLKSKFLMKSIDLIHIYRLVKIRAKKSVIWRFFITSAPSGEPKYWNSPYPKITFLRFSQNLHKKCMVTRLFISPPPRYRFFSEKSSSGNYFHMYLEPKNPCTVYVCAFLSIITQDRKHLATYSLLHKISGQVMRSWKAFGRIRSMGTVPNVQKT